MNSRNWKFLVLAPLTLTFLVACADKDKKGAPASPYAGMWLRQSAWADYNESISDAASFCPRVYQRPENHGINTKNGSISDVAWRIIDSGEVFHWTPSVRYDHPSAKSYAIGAVGPDGNFAMQAPVAGRNAYQYQARAANPYSRVFPVDAGRVNFSRWDGKVERYVRVSQAELQAYSSRLTECGPNLSFYEYSYGSQTDNADGPNNFQGPQSPYSSATPNTQGVPQGVPPQGQIVPEDGQYPPADFETPGANNSEFQPLSAVPTPPVRH